MGEAFGVSAAGPASGVAVTKQADPTGIAAAVAAPATRLYSGRSRVRPATVMPTMVTTALTAAAPMALAMLATPAAGSKMGKGGGGEDAR